MNAALVFSDKRDHPPPPAQSRKSIPTSHDPPAESEQSTALPTSVVVFLLDKSRYALDISCIDRVVRAVAITPLPKAPAVVSGIISVQGQVIPTVDVRKRFRLPSREMDLQDRLIIARTAKRRVALVVDSVAGVREIERHATADADQILPVAAGIRGVLKMEGDLVLIYDLEQFLSLDEEPALDEALSEAQHEAASAG